MIYVYFVKQKLFGYSPSSVLLNWNEIYFLHFIKAGCYGYLNQYHTNTISLIDITIPNQFAFCVKKFAFSEV